MSNEKRRETTPQHGRRSTDREPLEKDLPQPASKGGFKFLGGFLSLGLVTAIFSGGFSLGGSQSMQAEIVKRQDAQETKIEKFFEEMRKSEIRQTELMGLIANNTAEFSRHNEYQKEFNKQQEKSDARFEGLLEGFDHKLDKLDKQVIILQNGKFSENKKRAVPNDSRLAFTFR